MALSRFVLLLDTFNNFKILPEMALFPIVSQLPIGKKDQLNYSPQAVNDKKQCIRKNWVVSRGPKYTASNIPLPPFSTLEISYSIQHHYNYYDYHYSFFLK